jgi:hypothetical protein
MVGEDLLYFDQGRPCGPARDRQRGYGAAASSVRSPTAIESWGAGAGDGAGHLGVASGGRLLARTCR